MFDTLISIGNVSMSIAIRLRNGANYFSYTHIIEVGEGDEKSAGKLLLPGKSNIGVVCKAMSTTQT